MKDKPYKLIRTELTAWKRQQNSQFLSKRSTSTVMVQHFLSFPSLKREGMCSIYRDWVIHTRAVQGRVSKGSVFYSGQIVLVEGRVIVPNSWRAVEFPSLNEPGAALKS